MTKLTILIYTLLLISTTLYVTGHLKNDPSNKKTFSVSSRQIIVKADKKIIAKSKTDKKGNFEINFNMDLLDKRTFDFYVIDKTDTVFLKGFKEFKSDTPELTLFVKTK